MAYKCDYGRIKFYYIKPDGVRSANQFKFKLNWVDALGIRNSMFCAALNLIVS